MKDRFKFRAFLKDEAKRNASNPFILNKIFDIISIGFDSIILELVKQNTSNDGDDLPT